MIFAGFGSTHAADFGAALPPVKNIQANLRKMGMPVRMTGVIDQQTVAAVNGIFEGWDDVPPKLRTGRLTPRDVGKQLALVNKYVQRAATGATGFDQLPE